MKVAQLSTIIGYDADSGRELFTHPNVPTRDYQGMSNLPTAHKLYVSGFNKYRVTGVRVGSTEELWKIDVRVELRRD